MIHCQSCILNFFLGHSLKMLINGTLNNRTLPVHMLKLFQLRNHFQSQQKCQYNRYLSIYLIHEYVEINKPLPFPHVQDTTYIFKTHQKQSWLGQKRRKEWKSNQSIINLNLGKHDSIVKVEYLICHSIQNCNNTRQAAANSDTNNTSKCNTKHHEEYIKRQEDNTKPAKQKRMTVTLLSKTSS